MDHMQSYKCTDHVLGSGPLIFFLVTSTTLFTFFIYLCDSDIRRETLIYYT
ncbi:hypothetical protein Hanom_Chr15g01413091 [Helianthus anomalus]